MQSYQITDRKDFMQKLLNSDCFHSFLLKEATIHTAASYVIDGKINKDFFSKEELEDSSLVPYDYTEWQTIRPLCFDLIKGKRTPLRFRFVLYLKPQSTEKVLLQGNFSESVSIIKHLVLNILFDEKGMFLTTGIDYSGFTLNKEADQIWDKSLERFLESKEITFSSAV